MILLAFIPVLIMNGLVFTHDWRQLGPDRQDEVGWCSQAASNCPLSLGLIRIQETDGRPAETGTQRSS